MYNISGGGSSTGSLNSNGARQSRGRLVCFNNGIVVNDSNMEISACVGFGGEVCGWGDVDVSTLGRCRSLLETHMDHCHVLTSALPTLREVSHRVMTFKDACASDRGGNRATAASGSSVVDAGVQRQVASLDSSLLEDRHRAEEGGEDEEEAEEEDEDDDDSDYDSEEWEERSSARVEGGGYCSLPNCARMFPHSHVGEGGNDTVFGLVQRQGAEALAKDFYSKV
jgi:hypothetical protein